ARGLGGSCLGRCGGEGGSAGWGASRALRDALPIAANEPGLGGFEIILWDNYGSLGDVTGQDTHDMFNQPLSNMSWVSWPVTSPRHRKSTRLNSSPHIIPYAALSPTNKPSTSPPPHP